MVERTRHSELEEALKAFCDREYRHNGDFTAKDITLFAVDCGGYDITNEVTLEIKNGKFKLRVVTKQDAQFKPTEVKEFELELKDE